LTVIVQSDEGVVGLIRNILISVLVVAVFLFIFGPVFGLRDTGTQTRSKRIAEEHERRIRETLEYSERERRRTEEFLNRAEKEIFGNR